MTKIFIDGSAGTTGLRLLERLSGRSDIQLLTLPEALRKDSSARKDQISQADIVFLCLPDAAAVEAVSLAEGSKAAIIDTSTAHRVNPDWTYGFPELTGQRERIRASRRIANPGCHASGVIALLYPLIKSGLLPDNTPLTATSLTGYSGGGKKMIAEYEADALPPLYDGPRLYGLSQQHKHLPEIVHVCGLTEAPVFCPIVAPYYAGMEVMIGLHAGQVNGPLTRLAEVYADFYAGARLVRYEPHPEESGFMSASAFAGRDDMQVSVTGNDERAVLTARFDNLGKGASGAAIQNMNILMGLDETTGLVL